MPKRGSGRSNFNNYYEHDMRGDEVRRTVSFKPTRGNHSGGGGGSSGSSQVRSRKNQPNLNYSLIRSYAQHQYDTDVPMAGSGHRNTHAGDGRRRLGKGRGRNVRQNSPAPMRTFHRLSTSPTFWFKVHVPFGAKYEKNWIIESLNAGIAPETFTAVGTQGRDVFFYLDDHKAAEKLFNLHMRLTTEDNHKLGVKVSKINPNITVDEVLKELLKVVMCKRFRPDTRALDLSQFHMDPDLVERFVPLNQKSVLSAILTLVADNCPTLHALDLSRNNIYSLEGVRSHFSRLTNLRILHLANNQMSHISNLDPLKGLCVEELLMDRNPVCDKYVDQGAYVTDVRKRLQKLLKLDGIVLPPPILFDVETAQLPPSRGSYLCAEEGKEIARQFLEQYYAIYDSGNREPLRDAYHEKAMLSMCCNFQPGQAQGHSSREKAMPNSYHASNRNLKRGSDLERRMRLLMCGHNEIMKLLSGLPSTQHDPHSFAVDLLLFTPQLIQLCVCGVFRETRASSNTPMRAFSRSLIIVPQGQGFCIVNETITITNATSAQADAAFKTSLVPVAPVPAIAPAVVPLVPVPVSPSVGIPTVETKRQMVEHVARTSGMNFTWSEKCLEESNWNLDQALYAFSELHKQGTIPEEAFAR